MISLRAQKRCKHNYAKSQIIVSSSAREDVAPPELWFCVIADLGRKPEAIRTLLLRSQHVAAGRFSFYMLEWPRFRTRFALLRFAAGIVGAFTRFLIDKVRRQSPPIPNRRIRAMLRPRAATGVEWSRCLNAAGASGACFTLASLFAKLILKQVNFLSPPGLPRWRILFEV
jgi:hypothetical protein